ncbi:protein translocase subunit SecF [Nitrosomonas sp.]|uniref:protein translocase subunit SecF n=1 Tax=Nitrosomonas sp. TaxID=42353 RepID=UPI0025DE3311|nr:protein translocase subunit SecF [Nitrosomonas sp.]MBS0586362.1 protein translocase subunit SecF [Pseudomonadota bacterium]MBV6446958.1 Protein translocase subunit SecF [Nitrosomonas sp.]
MEFFRFKQNIPFMRWRRIGAVISIVTFLLSVYFIAAKGLNLGVDFTGGTVLEVSYGQAADLEKVRSVLTNLDMPDASVQNFGTSRDVLIRLPIKPEISSARLSETVMVALKQVDSSVEMKRVEFVGPQVGSELLENGALALLFVSLGIVAYLALRFEWKFGVAGIIANLHDVVIIVGCFAFFQWEFSLTVLAAILAILGYSVNESVVIFDRIRENFRKYRKASLTEVIDSAITQTMSRTVITHGCTQIVVIAMLLFGGEVLYYFALALTIGILFGIYSSIMVGSSIIMLLRVKREDLVKIEKKPLENDGAVV